MGKQYFRTVWISDTHLCSRDCQEGYLFDFLRSIKCEYLYIVGDFIDVWQLRRKWYWPHMLNRVIRRILKIADKGTRVVYIPGNHDEMMRDFIGFAFGKVEIRAQAVHQTLDGRRLLVLHGDEFDVIVRYKKWLSMLGSAAYDYTISANRILNWWRRKLNLPYYSFCGALKRRVKKAMEYTGAFEDALAREARRQSVDGVVCGHVHQPAIKDLHGVAYYNPGDWVENCSALVEDETGRMCILNWTHKWQEHAASWLDYDEDEAAVLPAASEAATIALGK